MVQTNYRLTERIGRHGAAFESDPPRSRSFFAHGAIRPGDLAILPAAFDGTDKVVRKLTAPAAADEDAILAAQTLAATAESFDGADLDGAIGGDRIFPPRNITLKLNSHSDWDVGTATVEGLDEHGKPQTEEFSVPDAGNTTLVGKKFFSRVIAISSPAGSGTNRVLDVGVGALLGPLTSLDVAGIVRYLARHQIGENATAEFAAGDVLNVIDEGLVGLEVEEDVKGGEQVYVRLVATGEEVVGAYRNDRDGTAAAPDAVPVIGLRFAADSVTGEDGVKLAPVQIAL